jgi:hypothetical protein
VAEPSPARATASYELPREDAEAVRLELAASISDLADAEGRVPCRMVTWLGTARRGRTAREDKRG